MHEKATYTEMSLKHARQERVLHELRRTSMMSAPVMLMVVNLIGIRTQNSVGVPIKGLTTEK